MLGLENDLIRVQGDLERLQHEREVDQAKIKDLQEENTALNLSQKNDLSASQSMQAELETMKGSVTAWSLLSEQLGKDAVTRVYRLELDNQRLQRELEASKTDLAKVEQNSAYHLETETRRFTADLSRLEEQSSRDAAALEKVEHEVLEVRREREGLQTVVETLRQQHKDLQKEKETEVESLAKQVQSLNARAANSQLVLLQEENKKMIAERTVLQTQASKAGHEKERLTEAVRSSRQRLGVLEEAEVRRGQLEMEVLSLRAELEQVQGLQEKDDLEDQV